MISSFTTLWFLFHFIYFSFFILHSSTCHIFIKSFISFHLLCSFHLISSISKITLLDFPYSKSSLNPFTKFLLSSFNLPVFTILSNINFLAKHTLSKSLLLFSSHKGLKCYLSIFHNSI